MNRLSLYILRQVWTPFIATSVVVTAIVWLTQTLQRVDIIVEHGQSLLTFGYLTSLILPSLFSVVIPFAVLFSILYALQRLHADSEIAVIFGAGVGRLRLAAPIVAVSLFAALLTLWINIDLMPRSYRTLKQEIASIRADIASVVIRSGEFSEVSRGFTVYVDQSLGRGRFSGLLIHDNRVAGAPVTYIARSGQIVGRGAQSALYLADGDIQRVDPENGGVDILAFSRIAIDLGQFGQGGDPLLLESTERYLGELLNPDLNHPYDKANAGKLIAEGHARLAGPLYAVSYALVAVAALTLGSYSRRRYGVRIAAACAFAGVLRVLGFVLQGDAAESGRFWLVYAPPIFGAIAALILLAKRYPPRPVENLEAVGA